MIYRKFKDKELSLLGLGVMRLPATGEGYGAPIDYPKAMELVEHAYKNGVNYYDTSYFYHSGDSENFIGKALKPFPRDSWYLASKMPGNMMRVENDKLVVGGHNLETKVFDAPVDVFEYQLERCGVDYFDFYLLHNVSETTYDIYTNEKLGMIDCLLEEKAKGRIGHLGFSSHGRHETIAKFLEYLEAKCPGAFEFAMIQFNYMDYKLQEAGKKYGILTEKGLSVFVMEPLRGGKLANLSANADTMLKAARPDDTHAAWAFRYIQSFENIPVMLSGMSSLEQLKENLKVFEKLDPVNEAEIKLLEKVRETITELAPCTGCNYCVEGCPIGLNIPTLLTMYNEAGFEVAWMLRAALGALKDEEKPAACIDCGSCMPLCPQNIDIPLALQKFNKLISEA